MTLPPERPVVFLHGLASRGTQDWPEGEWAAVLVDRTRRVLDLPAHGDAPGLGAVPTSAVLDALAEAIGPDEIDLVGYTLSDRLTWDLARHPGVAVRRLVLGGLSVGEPFALVDLPAARASIAGGPTPVDPLTGMIVHMVSLPGNRPDDLLDLIEGLATEPFAPEAGAAAGRCGRPDNRGHRRARRAAAGRPGAARPRRSPRGAAHRRVPRRGARVPRGLTRPPGTRPLPVLYFQRS